MFDVLSITAPIFVAIAVGFVTTRAGVFHRSDMRVFGKFVISLALPALLFRALATRPLAEILNPTYVLAYLGGSMLVMGLGWFWSRRAAGLDEAASAFRAMGMSCSNSGFIGYPILLLFLAPAAGIALALNMVVENLVMIPVLLLLADRRNGTSHSVAATLWRSLRRLAGNPMIIAIAAGLAVSVLALPLPTPLARSIDLFAAASGALSLFVIGGSLVGLPLRGLGRAVAPIAFGKLVLHPAAVALALWLLHVAGLPPLDRTLGMAAVLMAAMPMMSIYPTLAQAHGQEQVAAPALLVTTLASFLTLSALVAGMGRLLAA